MADKVQPREVIENLFKVETKTPQIVNGQPTKIVPFKLNKTQSDLDTSTLLHRMHVVLKARQEGVSTYVEARFLAKCLTQEGVHAAVVSHERGATIRLLRRVHFFLKQLEKDGTVDVPLEYDNKSELTFPKTGSSLYIGTAGQKAFTRGDMLTDFHGSEVAYWPDPDNLMKGVMGALTDDAEVFLESTANGMGGYFYDVCQAAMEAEGKPEKSAFKFHFYPWTMSDDYVRPVKPGTLWAPEELWLKEKYKLSDEQLAWRRWKITQYRSIEDFYQEFPINSDEAFIVTGTCYFDKTSLRLYQRSCKEPQAVGNVENLGEEARFMRYNGGKMRVWEFPQPMVEYLISADCSEGIESHETDNTAICVMNREKFSQAAVIWGKLDPSEAATRLYSLGKLYKWAWIAVEDNGPGLACLLKLKELGYPKIYRHKRYDLETQKETDKLGWHTDQRTRPLMLTELRQAIKHQTYLVRDEKFIRECSTFCKQKDGSYKANDGCHDDLVMANAIGVYLHKVLPYSPDEGPYGKDHGSREMFTHGHKTGY